MAAAKADGQLKKPPDSNTLSKDGVENRPPKAHAPSYGTRGRLPLISSNFMPTPPKEVDKQIKFPTNVVSSTTHAAPGQEAHGGEDPLQSPPLFKNTRAALEKPKPLSFAVATRASHQVPKFPGMTVRSLVVVDGEEMVRFSSKEVSQMASAFT